MKAAVYQGKYNLKVQDCDVPVKPFEVFKKEFTIKASFINPYTQGRAVSLLKSGRINVRDLITDKVKLTDINKVFEDNSYRSRGKIIIEP